MGRDDSRAAAWAAGLLIVISAHASLVSPAVAEAGAAQPAAEPVAGAASQVEVADPDEVVPLLDAPAGTPEPAAGQVRGLMPLPQEGEPTAAITDPQPAVPQEERGGDPVLAIDPVLEGTSSSRPVLRGLDKLLGNPAIAARPERRRTIDDPELDSLADAAAVKLDPPLEPADPVWRARSRPPVPLTGTSAAPQTRGELSRPGFLARATANDAAAAVVRMR